MAWRCAAYFPGITLGVLSMLNVLLAHTGSSGAIPLLAFFSLIALWFIISIPLCFSGAPRAPSALRHSCSACGWPHLLQLSSQLSGVFYCMIGVAEQVLPMMRPPESHMALLSVAWRFGTAFMCEDLLSPFPHSRS